MRIATPRGFLNALPPASSFVAVAIVLAVGASARAVELKIDIGVADVEEFLSGTPNDVQPGFSEFSVDPTQDSRSGLLDLANVETGITSRVFSGVTVGIEGTGVGGLWDFVGDGATYFDLAVGNGGSLVDLVNDGVFVQNGDLILTLANLPAGQYEMATFHYDVDIFLATFDLYLDVGQGESFITRAHTSQECNTDLTRPVTFQFTASGSDDVTLRLDGVGQDGGTLNGFTLVPVPEPASWLLLAVGIAGLIAVRCVGLPCS